jgi:hypothetical protein
MDNCIARKTEKYKEEDRNKKKTIKRRGLQKTYTFCTVCQLLKSSNTSYIFVYLHQKCGFVEPKITQHRARSSAGADVECRTMKQSHIHIYGSAGHPYCRIGTYIHKVHIFTEYHNVCLLVGIGTLPPTLSPASVTLPRNQRGDILACG